MSSWRPGHNLNIFDYDRPVHPALRGRLRTHKFYKKKSGLP